MAIIIETVNRGGRVLERHVFKQDSVSIGRGYDNDLIISDPYLEAHHAAIKLEGGQMVLDTASEQHGSVELPDQRLSDGEAYVESGTQLELGRTYLKVFLPNHPIAPALSASPVDRWFALLAQPWALILFAAFILGLIALEHYLSSYTEIKYAEVGLELVVPFVLAVIWSAFWSVIGRVFRHEGKFLLHLAASTFYLLVSMLIEAIAPVITFNLNNQGVGEIIGYILHGLGFAMLLALNLRFAFHQSFLKRQLFAQGIAWSLIGMVVLSEYSNAPEFSRYPSYITGLIPETFILAPSINETEFIQNAEALFEFEPEAME